MGFLQGDKREGQAEGYLGATCIRTGVEGVMEMGRVQRKEASPRSAYSTILGPHKLTLIAQGHACRCPTAVSTELHKEVSVRAEQALNGQVFHLVGVIHRRGFHVVSVTNDEPGPGGWQLCGRWQAQVGCGPRLR